MDNVLLDALSFLGGLFGSYHFFLSLRNNSTHVLWFVWLLKMMNRLVSLLKTICNQFIVFILEDCYCMCSAQITSNVSLGWCFGIMWSCDICVLWTESQSCICDRRIDCSFVLQQSYSLLIFETVGLIYLLGVIITLGGYAISIFGLPHLSVELPETVYSSLNDMKVLTMILTNSQLIESPQPLRGVIFSVIASILLLEWFIGRFFEHLLQLLDTSNLSY